MPNETIWGIVLIIVITLIYVPLIMIIYRWRYKQAVFFKSPYMIIIGGIGFYIDSLMNIIIKMTDSHDYLNCILSIVCTMTIHYIGYLCLIFRAKRIFKVMKLEKKYLDRIHNMVSLD